MFDVQFKIIVADYKSAGLFGYCVHEFVGKNVDLILPDVKIFNPVAMQNDLIRGKSTQSININVDKNGNYIKCRWLNHPVIKNGNVVKIISYIEKIYERKLFYNEIDILSDCDDKRAFVVFDRNFTIIDCSEFLACTLGFTRRYLMGKKFSTLASPEFNKDMIVYINNLLHNKPVNRSAGIINTKDGGILLGGWKSEPIMVDDKVTFILVTVTYIDGIFDHRELQLQTGT